jgi:hypothetical protein
VDVIKILQKRKNNYSANKRERSDIAKKNLNGIFVWYGRKSYNNKKIYTFKYVPEKREINIKIKY